MNSLELKALIYKYMVELLDYPYDRDIAEMDKKLNEFSSLLVQLAQIDERYTELAVRSLELKELFKKDLEKLGRDMFQAEYVSMFELGVRGPVCPPYESEYVKPKDVKSVYYAAQGVEQNDAFIRSLESKMEIANSVLTFYNKYGVATRGVIPDHVVAELEFMYYLAYKEYEAFKNNDVSEMLRYRSGQLEFLEKHLLRWFEKFMRCVKEKGTLSYYATLMQLINDFLIRDKEALIRNPLLQ